MKRFSIKGGVWRSNESLFRPTAVESNAVAVVSVNVPADGKLSPGVGDVSVITGGMLSLAVTANVSVSRETAVDAESCTAGLLSAVRGACPQTQDTPPCMNKMPSRMSE